VRIGVLIFTRTRTLIACDPPPTSPSPFITALAAGTGLRLLAMLGYPGALWFAGDSYVYLGAALRLRPDLSKTTGYSLFLRALEPFHSLTLVVGVQHLMGLGVAVMIYLLLRRGGVSPRWATAATLPVLLDGFEIEDEHIVMAEALFTFLIVLAMLLILWRARVPWPVALLAGLLVGYAVDVRSEGLPVLVLFPGFLLLRALSRGGWRNWRHRSVWLAAIVMAVGCAVPVLGYAAWSRSWNGSWTLSRSDGFYLWGRVSSFAECSVIRPPAGHSWIPGGTAYSDAVQYGHAIPSRVVKPFAILIDGYERVFYVYGPLFGLILITGLGGVVRIRRRPATPDPAHGFRPARQHAALGHRDRPARVPDRGHRLRLQVPATRPPVRLPGRGPGFRPGPVS
jgi:Dolichyl-phosphate-mannose-protein mannosyltransferase